MTAAAGGLDTLVFTAGIGEHSPTVRAAATRRLGHLGVLIDDDRNDGAHGDADISHPRASARSLVIAAREDLQITRETRSVLSASRLLCEPVGDPETPAHRPGSGITQLQPRYAGYQQKTDRAIPVIRLSRAD